MERCLVVPGRPAADALTWWVLTDGGAAPQPRLEGPVAAPAGVPAGLTVHPLFRAELGHRAIARSVFIMTATGLVPDARYRLFVTAAGTEPSSAESRTLPAPVAPGTPFTVALGSCYCAATDPGLELCYPPDVHRDEGPDPVRLRFLGGDQIYMDLSADSGSPLIRDAPDPWQRYPRQWRKLAFRKFLVRSPTLALADDHEFWNDAPHGSAWLLWTPDAALQRSMDRALEVFQLALNVDPRALAAAPQNLPALLANAARSFDLRVGPLRFHVLDVRTRRTRFDADPPHVAPGWLADAVRWIDRLDGPGFLVVAQPLVETAANWFSRVTHTLGDANLPEYPEDFARLWHAIFRARHDVAVLSGDIHWSRVLEVSRATSPDRRVFDVVSSALSRIPQGTPDAGEPTGNVEWDRPGGRASWVRRRAATSTPTYTTLSLTALSSEVSTPIRVQATAWGPRPGGVGASPLYQDTFVLR